MTITQPTRMDEKRIWGRGEKGIKVRKFIYQMKRLYVKLLMGYLKIQFVRTS
jgi:hypothetical protein